MTDEARKRRLAAEENARDIKKLQVEANMMSSAQAERLDWMYEQASTKTKEEQDHALMNTMIKGQKDEDVENMKKLESSVAGSLFLSSATSATQDMMSKLREDPLFQIKQAEVRRKESIMSNPLIRERIKQKQARKLEKQTKKLEKKAKKREKKEKKIKKKKKRSSSSSSSSSSSPDPGSKQGERGVAGARSRSPHRGSETVAMASDRLRRRQEEEALKAKARGRSNQGLSAEEKAKRLKEMMNDGKSHEKVKDSREKDYTEKEEKLEEVEKNMREKNDRTVFKKMNQATYMSGSVSMEDRIKSGRHRRQKGIFDPLEKD